MKHSRFFKIVITFILCMTCCVLPIFHIAVGATTSGGCSVHGLSGGYEVRTHGYVYTEYNQRSTNVCYFTQHVSCSARCNVCGEYFAYTHETNHVNHSWDHMGEYNGGYAWQCSVCGDYKIHDN